MRLELFSPSNSHWVGDNPVVSLQNFRVRRFYGPLRPGPIFTLLGAVTSVENSPELEIVTIETIGIEHRPCKTEISNLLDPRKQKVLFISSP